MAKAHLVVLLVFLLPCFSAVALEQDFCVANPLLSDTPSGYPCKPELLVSSSDFSYSGLARPGPTINPFNAALTTAYVAQFPALNGLGISAARFDIFPGGVVPLLTHPRTTELVFCVSGTMVAGLISANSNTVYIKTLNKGDLFVFPKGLLHFLYNSGNTTAVGFAAYSSSNPGLQIVDWALFKNNLPSEIINKVTFISRPEITRLKTLFGGSG